jgi:HD-like signal output (HDOD) protein
MKGLPALPASVARLTRVLDDPASSARDVSLALGADQSLAGKVLQIVNSPFYGFPRRVETLDHAVAILGYRPIRELVLVTCLFQEIDQRNGSSSLDRKRLWRHALGTGAAAKTLSKSTGRHSEESVFLAGLLHDIGKVLLDVCLREDYAAVVELARQENLLIIEAEERLLGTTHAEFGYWLAEEWNLPLSLTSAVLHHHEPSRAKDHYMLVCLVHLGDVMARAMEIGYGGDELIPAIDRQAWAALNLTPKLFETTIGLFLEDMDGSDFWMEL